MKTEDLAVDPQILKFQPLEVEYRVRRCNTIETQKYITDKTQANLQYIKADTYPDRTCSNPEGLCEQVSYTLNLGTIYFYKSHWHSKNKNIFKILFSMT